MIFARISKITDPILVKLDRWFDESVRFVPNLLIAILILAIFRFLARYGSRFMEKGLTRASQNIALVSLT